jgi:hypothetical protein
MDESQETGKVTEWLSTTGFPLEHTTARVLEKAGFTTDQGRLYVDVESAIRREVDVLARTTGPEDLLGDLVVRLIVECKFSAKPWVVLTRPGRIDASDLLSWVLATDRVRAGLVDRVRRAEGRGLPPFLTSTPDPHGSSLVAMPRRADQLDDRLTPQDALQQLLAAARGILAETPDALALVWPLLVIRGSLYQAVPDGAGSLRAEPAEWQRLVWGGVTGQPVVIDVVRERYLESYARRAHDGLRSTEQALHAAMGDPRLYRR